MLIPGIDLNEIVDGKTIAQHWQYWTINVRHLNSMTPEQFIREYPNAYERIKRANDILDKLDKLLNSTT